MINKDKIDVINPSTRKKIDSISTTSSQDLEMIFQKAKKCAQTYNFSSFNFRKDLLIKFRKEIVKNMDLLIQTICNETGKKEFEALMEVFISIEHLQNSLNNLSKYIGKKRRRVGILKTKKVWVEYDPMGVAGIISPWNYPLILTMSPIVEALLAGNSVIIKPSEHTPLTTVLLKEIWDNSTRQPDIMQAIFGKADIGNELVCSEYTDIICFTGSTSVGKKIAQVCAPIFKPVILELGGKDPMIILEDADIDRSVQAALWGGFSNAGQTCISVEQIFVQETIYTEIVNKLSRAVRKLSSGFDEKKIGAIANNENLMKIKDQIDEVKGKVEIIEGSADEGWFIPPTIVLKPPLKSKISNQETFGPVITINPFKEDSEAIKLANITGYGLSASIFGSNFKRMKFISKRIKTGSICFNDVKTHYGIADLPFGGIGKSGIGKVHGKEGIRAFSNQKAYLDNRILFQSELWWFNRRGKIEKLLKHWVRWWYA